MIYGSDDINDVQLQFVDFIIIEKFIWFLKKH